ncbi:MCE family protein [bacterium]|nr:MCE family protein [bacterium]
MQDVDGIIVGSPVKMLGITIGYVKNLKPVNDNVFVDFIITEKGIKIPKGSLLTVEFSGLASSKSIEIYPPKSANISETQNIIVQQPRRINAAVGLLNEMFNKISEIIFKFTRFSNSLSESLENEYKNNKKVSDKKKEKMNIDFKKMNDELININKLIDNQQNNIDNRLKREKQ